METERTEAEDRAVEAADASAAAAQATAEAATASAAGAQPEESAVELDLAELQAKAAQRDEYLALAQRTQADFENYRKRMSREVAAAEGRGVSKLAKELLPALDDLERGVRATGDDGHLTEGLRLVHAQLTAALARLGIEGYAPQGEPFDPNVHEAMAQQPVEGAPAGTVVEVYQQGWRLKDQVLRPARVVVAA